MSTKNTNEEPTPGYNTKIPESIMTPDKVKTRVGTLEFFDGIPTEKTAALLYDNLDFLRGVETFLNGLPAASLEAFRRGQATLAGEGCNKVLIFDQLMDSTPLFLTGNTDTVYCSAFLDLKKDGPTVLEIPPGTGPGTVNEAFFRFVIDTGPPGPDRAKGGKYLILPPDYDGDVPDGYFVAKSTSWVNWFIAGSEPTGDGVHRRDREGIQHHPLYGLQLLRRTPRRHRPRADRDARTRVARTLFVRGHPEGQAICPGRPDEEAAD